MVLEEIDYCWQRSNPQQNLPNLHLTIKPYVIIGGSLWVVSSITSRRENQVHAQERQKISLYGSMA
jgi:hypothetical protein